MWHCHAVPTDFLALSDSDSVVIRIAPWPRKRRLGIPARDANQLGYLAYIGVKFSFSKDSRWFCELKETY